MSSDFLEWSYYHGLRCWSHGQRTQKRVVTAVHHSSTYLWDANKACFEYSGGNTMLLKYGKLGESHDKLCLELTPTMDLVKAWVDEFEFPDKADDDPETTVHFPAGHNLRVEYELRSL